MFLKRIFQLMLIILLPGIVAAQVTTSTITGTVKTSDGKPVAGATVKAVHVPTGSVYTSVSTDAGLFNLPNLRVGGPYTVTSDYTGLQSYRIEDINTVLGTPLVLDIVMKDKSNDLNNVTVTATSRSNIISSLRNGTSTSLSLRQIQAMPTVNRNIQDFARLMPQVKVGTAAGDGSATGISFGGQNNRYNQFTIDGANASDGFGLGSSGTNGGQANVNPISMEVIQQIQMVMSPYDVTQGGFTGGGINAVTKSGSNTIHGSAYGQFQNQGFVGKSAGFDSGITRNKYQNFTNKTYGLSLSGPIVKNKVFFYANYEGYRKTTPLAFDPTVKGSGSFVNPDTLAYLRNYLISKYNYDPGTYGALTNHNSSNSVFAKIDWNIDDKNKLMVRFNHVDGYNDILSRSAYTGTFSNSGYRFNDKNNSFVAELTTNNSSNSSNVLRFTYTSVRDSRAASSNFPSLTLLNYNFANQSSITYNIGAEGSSVVNGLNQDSYTLTDNFTLYKGRHTFTFGTDNAFYKSTNWFLQYFNGSYTYGTTGAAGTKGIDAFVNNTTAPNSYSVGYGTADSTDRAPATLKAAQLSVYAQDVWAVNDNFKLTYGLRIDAPFFFNTPAENVNFNTTFLSYGVKTNQMPKSTPLISPRVGFNWNVDGKGITQFRGGAGVFTGRIPFVWISNQFSNTGIASQNLAYSAAQASTANIRFNYNPNGAHLGAYIPSAANVNGLVINVIDKNFKFPQVFRANLAVDQKLPIWGLVGTLEAVYTKTLNNATYQNINISAGGDSTVLLGSSLRPYWNKFTKGPTYGNVIKLQNTSEGYSYNLTAQIQKPYENGWSGSIAYTYGHSTSLNDLTSSVAQSNWRSPVVAYGLNNPTTSRSNFDLGSRIVGYISKEFKYGKNASTSFTLIYTGQSGQLLSYVYASNVQGDYGIGSNSGSVYLAYLPTSMADARLVDINGGKTAAQQWSDYQMVMNSNKYLSKNAGTIAKRNGDRLPWENHFDFKISQNFMVGSNKLELYFSILNVGNLINKNSGWAYASSSTDAFGALSYANKSLFSAVTSGAVKVNGTTQTAAATVNAPYTQFNLSNFTRIQGTYRPYTVADFASRWTSVIGARFSF